MKELMRMEQVVLEEHLDRYCLTVYEGDIMYIQSFSENSLHALMELLSGVKKPEQGRLYMDEREVTDFGIKQSKKDRVYVVTFGMEFVDKMTIAENLQPVKKPFCLYSARKNEEKIRAYFQQENVDLDPRMPVWKLTGGERRKMGILRAKLFGARLVILDMSRIQIEGKTAEEICETILKMNGEGMTFLILSSKYTPVARVATRTQYLAFGRDIKEWGRLDENLRTQMSTGDIFFHRTRNSGQQEGLLTGMYDYEWEMSDGIWKYLSKVKEDSPEIWETYIGGSVPEEGEVHPGKTVIIPKYSGEMLLDNLSIGDNLTIAAGRRIAHGKYGFIHRRLQRRLVHDFYKKYNINPGIKHVHELTKVQRKILSVARWEITKPETIFLEMPYLEMNSEEAVEFREYLSALARKGIRIIYLSKSKESMYTDCCLIIHTVNGTGAKIDTFFKKFPPLES